MTEHMIHRFWIGDESSLFGFWTGRVVGSTCGRRPTDWTPDSLPSEIAVPEGEPRHVANVVRYQLLKRFGGLWLDHDMIPLVNLTGASEPWVAEIRGIASGCCMWFPEPGHPLFDDLLTNIEEGVLGDRVLQQAIIDHPDVNGNPSVLPFDSAGTMWLRDQTPTAVHLWATSARRV